MLRLFMSLGVYVRTCVYVICVCAHKHVQMYSPGQVHVEVGCLDHISPTIVSLPYSLFLKQGFLLTESLWIDWLTC